MDLFSVFFAKGGHVGPAYFTQRREEAVSLNVQDRGAKKAQRIESN
jgi:hypothetical protein